VYLEFTAPEAGGLGKSAPNAQAGQAPYMVDMRVYNNYYPFGMAQPDRHGNTEGYRYGFNGKEMDNEVKENPTTGTSGVGNSYAYRFRKYGTRIGRMWSTDPLAKSFPWNSSYAFSENRIIDAIELEGLEKVVYQYNFTSEKITRTKIELEKAGPLGDGVLVSSNHGGIQSYYYGNEITPSIKIGRAHV